MFDDDDTEIRAPGSAAARLTYEYVQAALDHFTNRVHSTSMGEHMRFEIVPQLCALGDLIGRVWYESAQGSRQIGTFHIEPDGALKRWDKLEPEVMAMVDHLRTASPAFKAGYVADGLVLRRQRLNGLASRAIKKAIEDSAAGREDRPARPTDGRRILRDLRK